MGLTQIHKIYLDIMDFRKIIVIIIISLVLLSNCKPQPNLGIIVNTSFKVTPNTKKISLGDTLRFSLSANANFPTSSGGTYFANDATLSSSMLIIETDLSNSNGFVNSRQDMFRIFTQRGFVNYNQGGSMFAKIMTNCVNNEYNVDMFIIPQKKDTFIVQLTQGNLFSNKYSVGAKIDFNGNNQNLELVPLGGADRSVFYGFIVE